MGGGNGLKSHMSQKKNQAKKDAKGAGGGGAAGKEARMTSSEAINCAVCKAPFTSARFKTQLTSHHDSKHSKLSFQECFPGVDP
jgi:hypothetical protein